MYLHRALFLICILLASNVSAADPASATSPANPLSQIQNRLDALGSGEEGDKPKLREIYQQTLSYLQQQQEFSARAEEYNELITRFSDRTSELERQIQNWAPPKPPPTTDVTTAELEQRRSVNNAGLLNLKNRENELGNELTLVASRRIAIPDRISELKSMQEQLIDRVSDEQSNGDELSGARKSLESAHLTALTTEIRMLELELLSSDNQQTLLKQQIRLVELEAEALSQQLDQQQKKLVELRRLEAQEAVARSRQGAGVDTDSHVLLQREASHNDSLSGQLTGLTESLERAAATTAANESLSERISNSFSRIKKQLQWLKVSTGFGQTLRQELDELPQLPDLDALFDQQGEAQFASYELEKEAELIEQPESWLASLEAEAEPPLSGSEKATLQNILEARRTLIPGLLDGYRNLLAALAQQEVATQELYNQILQFRQLIDQHLLWVPNTGPINAQRLPLLIRNLEWLLSGASWRQVISAGLRQPAAMSGLLALSCIFVAGMILTRNRLSHLHQLYGSMLGKVTRDKFSHTLHLLAASVFYALPLPLFIYLFARIIGRADDLAFARGLGDGLEWSALLLWLWLSLRNLSSPQGFFCGHLHWNETAVGQWIRQLRRLLWFSVPLIIIISIAEHLNTEAIRSTLGRLSFVIWCLGISLYFWRQLREQSPLAVSHNERLTRLTRLLLSFAPLVFAGLSLAGYLYTGLKLLTMVMYSLMIAAGLVITYCLAIRGLLVQERRIAFDQAKARRAEILAQRAREEDAGSSETGADLVDESYIDLKTISDQTRGLVKTLLWIAFAASMWALWSPLFSALEQLDNIVVWETAFTLNGIEQLQPITLKAFLLSTAILLLMWISIRNLPGVMQLLILQHISLSPGTGYAITTLMNYLLIMVGVVVSFNILGFDWAKMQWLIAALGVGLGFGLQEIFANFVSGLIILFEKPIRIGDTVTINGLTGTVSKIQIRATTIVDWDRKEIIVPNKSFITEQLVNWSLSDPITRVKIAVGVAYGSDTVLVERLLLEAAGETAGVLASPKAEAYFFGFGDSTLNYELRVYVSEMADRNPVIHSLHNLIDQKFRDHKVDIAFPQLDVRLRRS